MPKPEFVLFDIGNVLVGWQPERFFDSLMSVSERKNLFATVDLDGMNKGVDLGAPFRESVYELAAQHPEFEDIIRQWHDRWIEMASPVIDHSVHLLRALRRKKIPVLALSNFGIDSLVLASKHYPFLTEFDKRYISGHLGVMKPDPRIYEIVEGDCDCAPDRLLFADDRPENIEVAKARGWQTHLFEGPTGWAETLVKHDLLTRSEATM